MAKRMKPAGGGNGFDAETVRSFVGRIENLHADIASAQATYMAEAKTIREDIADVYEEAKARGVNTKALKTLVKTRELDRKAKAAAEKLDIDERATLELLKDALGELADTPLGEAAVAKAGGKKASGGLSGAELAEQVGESLKH